jgi:uncharacterized protein YfaQ (DUF2300 family)
MNKKLVLPILILALCSPAFAKHKAPLTPVAQVSQFCDLHLDTILAPLSKKVTLPRTLLAKLQNSLNTEAATATPEEKGEITKGLAICTTITSIMDDREKTIATLKASAAVPAPTDLGATRKDDPDWIQAQQEAHEEKNYKHESAQTSSFLNSADEDAWARKATQYRTEVTAAVADLEQASK